IDLRCSWSLTETTPAFASRDQGMAVRASLYAIFLFSGRREAGGDQLARHRWAGNEYAAESRTRIIPGNVCLQFPARGAISNIPSCHHGRGIGDETDG